MTQLCSELDGDKINIRVRLRDHLSFHVTEDKKGTVDLKIKIKNWLYDQGIVFELIKCTAILPGVPRWYVQFDTEIDAVAFRLMWP